jgi:HEPN domain-containing protein
MAADPIKVTDTQAWLIKAQRDLLAAEQLVAQTHPLLDAVVYHCQQAGEKALKGFLFWHESPFRKTHNLVELLDQCLTIDATLAILEETAVFLTPLVSEFRYPGPFLEPSSHEAEEALNRARAVLVEIIKRLPEEVAPHTA